MDAPLLSFLFVGAVLFYQLASKPANVLVAVIISIFYAVACVAYVKYSGNRAAAANTSEREKVQQSVMHKSDASPYYPASKVARRLKYVYNNRTLLDILADLRFVRVFDKARYSELIVHMENFQKTYVYILADRYIPELQMATLIDLRDYILELMYSLTFAVPKQLKHTYGLRPYVVIENNIKLFRRLSDKMLAIVDNYARHAKGAQYTPQVSPAPYEDSRENCLP